MTTNKEIESSNQLEGLFQGGAIIVLIMHFYYFCYGAFVRWGLHKDLVDRVIMNFSKTGLFKNTENAKLIALVFLSVSAISGKGRKDLSVTWKSCLLLMGIGILLFFGSRGLLDWWYGSGKDLTVLPVIYMAVTILGYLLIVSGVSRMSRILRNPFSKDDPFGKAHSGFPQEEKKKVTAYSINLPAQYTVKGKVRESWVNIINARRGVLIIGNPGCGKSRFVIEPILRQVMEKGMALLVYDFKFDALSRQVYHLFQQNSKKYPAGAAFYCVNFSDLSRSHRCNVLDPKTMEWIADAIGASKTIMLSMNKTWINRQGDFFVESPINFLAAVIWWLRRYEDGKYCTLPHAIELAQVPYNQLFSLLRQVSEIEVLINPFIEAYQNKSREMLDGQISSAKIALGRLSSPDLYYILTGNDCNLEINDPEAPKIFCLGGSPPRQEALAPILSLYMDRVNKLVNQAGKYPCALVCDEFATVRVYSMTETIATARSNNIVPVLAVQDISQLRTQYSRDEADLIMNISGNIVCGQVGGETAKWVSDRIPRVWQDRTTISTNSNDTSINQSRQWEQPVTAATVATLSSGEFMGIVADDPGQELELKAFHAKLRREESGTVEYGPLPVVRVVDHTAVKEAYERVKREVREMVVEEMERMIGDDMLKGLIIH